MALIQNWMPPSKENWEFVVYVFQFFPLFTLTQWLHSWYPAGKSSIDSKLNLPGKIGWITMEVPGFITLLYCMNTIPKEIGLTELPWENKLMGALFVIHYIYRAIIGPLMAPSISPFHILIWVCGVAFQVTNGMSIGGYLSGYGTSTGTASSGSEINWRVWLGMAIFALGLLGNMYHDDELREIRREAARKQKLQAEGQDVGTGKGSVKVQGKGVDKVYMMPENGLFSYILYPHYFCEWIEWTGFWIMGGWGCVPARNFLFNEIATMLPRAVQGKQWYLKRFGVEKVGGRKAVIPGIV